MSCALPSQPRQDWELKFETEASILAIVTYLYFECPVSPKWSNLQNLVVTKLLPAIGHDTLRVLRVMECTPNRNPAIDLTMGEEIVVVPCSTPRLHNETASSESLVANAPQCVTGLLEDWYTENDRLKPPPCAVGPRIARGVNKWKTGHPVVWTYMGFEVLKVTYYELNRFENNNDRFIIVAEGPTQGPFIIKRLQSNKCYSPPLPYHIWEGIDRADPQRRRSGFQQKPSIFKRVKVQKEEYEITQTGVGSPFQIGGFLPASRRVFNNSAQTPELEQPMPSAPLSCSESTLQLQVTYQGLNFTATADNDPAMTAYEKARDDIFATSSSQSPPRNLALQKPSSYQRGDADTIASPSASPLISQTVLSALPMTPHPNITQCLATAARHPLTSELQCSNTKGTTPPPDLAMPSTTRPSPDLTQSEFPAKKLISILSSVEQEGVPPMGCPIVLCSSPQPILERKKEIQQECQMVELNFCQKVLTELMDQKHFPLNQPFLRPVDPVALNVPTYFQVIKQPMDLSKIQQKLAAGDYQDAHDFKKDICLMFKNCNKFNWKSDPVYKSGRKLNELFAQLWTKWTSGVQVDYHVQKVNTHIPYHNSGNGVARERRPTIEPFTPPTISESSPTPEYAAEESQLSSPLGEEAGRVQAYGTVAETQYTRNQDYSPDTTTPQLNQAPLLLSDDHELPEFSDQTNSDPLGHNPPDIYEHHVPDHCLQMPRVSSELSGKSWEDLRSSRESSYISEMLMQTEREFSLSKPKDYGGAVNSDDNARHRSSPGCKRKWESTKKDKGRAVESALKKPPTVHPSQAQSKACFQPTSKKKPSKMSSEEILVNALRAQNAPPNEACEPYGEVFGKTSSLTALPDGHSPSIRQCLVNQIVAVDNLQPDSVTSPALSTATCPVPPTALENVLVSSIGASKISTNSEDGPSHSPQSSLTERGTLGLRGSFAKKTFKHKTLLTRHAKIVHLRKKTQICPLCGRRFGRRDALVRHLSDKGCPFKDRHHRESEEHSSQDQVPVAAEQSINERHELRDSSPALPDQLSSTAIETAQDGQDHPYTGVAHFERRPGGIAGQSPALNNDQEQNFDLSVAKPHPLKHETMEEDGFMEILPFPTPATISPSRLKKHIRENVMFLFYNLAGNMISANSFSECDSVYKLFGLAVQARAFGLADERLKPNGNVLSICFGAGQSGLGRDMRVIQGSEKQFQALVNAIEQKDWWSESNGVVVGSGILEVRVLG